MLVTKLKFTSVVKQFMRKIHFPLTRSAQRLRRALRRLVTILELLTEVSLRPYCIPFLYNFCAQYFFEHNIKLIVCLIVYSNWIAFLSMTPDRQHCNARYSRLLLLVVCICSDHILCYLIIFL